MCVRIITSSQALASTRLGTAASALTTVTHCEAVGGAADDATPSAGGLGNYNDHKDLRLLLRSCLPSLMQLQTCELAFAPDHVSVLDTATLPNTRVMSCLSVTSISSFLTPM